MKFDQLAVVADNAAAQAEAMRMCGGTFSVLDTVTAVGLDEEGNKIQNVAELAFAYDVFPGLEYEVLRYLPGEQYWNWHMLAPFVGVKTSHYGIHVQTEEEIDALRGIYGVPLQEVVTIDHSNPACANRRYHYVIFSAPHLGCELKAIRRLTLREGVALREKLTS